MSRYVVLDSDVITVANRLAASSGEPFEQRDSDNLGGYCLFQAFLGITDLQVKSNLDPLYQPGIDPLEDRFFDALLVDDAVIIELEREDTNGAVEAALRIAFPELRCRP